MKRSVRVQKRPARQALAPAAATPASANAGSRRNTARAQVDGVINKTGEPLPADVRSTMGERLGFDFSRVRIHRDDRAADSAVALHARAFTVGRHVVFARGEYAPRTPVGKRLLTHELVHVVQQRGQPVLARSALDLAKSGPRESEAEQLSGDVARSGGVTQRQSPNRILRQEEPAPTTDEATEAEPSRHDTEAGEGDWWIERFNAGLDIRDALRDAEEDRLDRVSFEVLWTSDDVQILSSRAYSGNGPAGVGPGVPPADSGERAFFGLARPEPGGRRRYVLEAERAPDGWRFSRSQVGSAWGESRLSPMADYEFAGEVGHVLDDAAWQGRAEVIIGFEASPDGVALTDWRARGSRGVTSTTDTEGIESELEVHLSLMARAPGGPGVIGARLDGDTWTLHELTWTLRPEASAAPQTERAPRAIGREATEREALARLGIPARSDVYGAVFREFEQELEEVALEGGLRLAAFSAEQLALWLAGGVLLRAVAAVGRRLVHLSRALRANRGIEVARAMEALGTEADELAELLGRVHRGGLSAPERDRLEELLARVDDFLAAPVRGATLPRTIEGTRGLQHSFDRHGAEWFGREVFGGTDMTAWQQLIERATESSLVFEGVFNGRATVAYLARVEGRFFVVHYWTESELIGELATAFPPNRSTLRRYLHTLGLAR